MLVALILSLLLSGCGVRYVYSQLDWIVPWYLRDYVSLDGAQRAALDERLGERLDWHCRSQLPGYAQWLRETESMLARGRVERTDLGAHLARAEGFWDELMAALVDDVSHLLAGLTDEQVSELRVRFEARNQETREEFVDPPDEILHDRRVERTEKRLRRWLGRMSAEQRMLIETWSRQLEPVAADWLANRVEWQRRLGAALDGRADRDAFDARITALMRQPEFAWSADYRTRIGRNRELTLDLIADVYESATPRQRERALREIDSLAGQFERLACTQPEGSYTAARPVL
jgi:hypothetical protein